jgi:catechol 2,3-dioxygenase-like lactoylglutathione lyase family enzyme
MPESDQTKVPADWLAEFEAAARRPLELRIKYGFIKTYRPVLDVAPFRSFDTMEDYRRWCEENLPDWLGFGRTNMIANLNLLVLRCRDIDLSRGFYERLGLSFTKHRHGTGTEHYAHERDGFVLELYPASADDRDRTGLGFNVQDLEALRGDLVSASLAPSEIAENPWGRSFVVRDPDGRRVEITSR